MTRLRGYQVAITAPMRKLAATYALSVSRSLDSSPIGGAKGGCAAGFALTCPLRQAAAPPIDPRCNFGALGSEARPLALPLGELARLKAVTERGYAVANMEKLS